MVSFLLNLSVDRPIPKKLESCFVGKPADYSIFSENENELIFFGDAIFEKQLFTKFRIEDIGPQWINDHVGGHFYYFLKNSEGLVVGNSNFSILPVYYYQSNDVCFVSNTVEAISAKIDGLTLNKRFTLENILFNYPLFNETCFKETKLLPSNSFITFQNNAFEIKQLKPIEAYFTDAPRPWRKSVDYIADFFIEQSVRYFPDEKYAASLTGGFDGRTLVGLGKYHKKQFVTYSFGSKQSEDVKIAAHLTSLANIEFIPFDLDENYTKNVSHVNGLDFIRGSAGNASFSRAHYMHSVKELAKEYKFLITGNFGSEVFRAAHIAGVVISPNLFQLFHSSSFDEGISAIENSTEFKWIKKEDFKDEWEDLKDDLNKLPCFDANLKGLTRNQQFYKFAFEEIFRKYFGAEMANQFQYLVNRTPFLDFDFIKEILQTELSGVYSDFFTNNPLKRFKGQVVYADVIKKTYPDFGKEMTDKGYRPDDLLSFTGKLRISKSYFKKKVLKIVPPAKDAYSVEQAFYMNQQFWNDLHIDDRLFRTDVIHEAMHNLKHRDSLFIVLSQIWYLNYLAKTHGSI